MNKKLAAVLAATCVLGATTAFAANPFSDVEQNHWAYQAVEVLADEGIIEGYPDGQYKGERNITRYEMAQMVARAMAREDQANEEQKAMINRLADEFASELNSLGVRVSNLENRVGNVKITGDARLRYQETDKSKFDMRARLQFNAQVAKNTTAVARVVAGNYKFGGDDEGDIKIDRLFVRHQMGDFAIQAGRYAQTFGETGYWYDDEFDGVKALYNNGRFNAEVGYGYGRVFGENLPSPLANSDKEVVHAGLGYTAKNFGIQGFYLEPKKQVVSNVFENTWSVGGHLKASKLKLSGEYVKTDLKAGSGTKFWVGRLDYSKADYAKVGSYNLFVDYVQSDLLSYYGGTGSWRDIFRLFATKSWGVGVAYVPVKNVKIEAFQTFNSKFNLPDEAEVEDKGPKEYTRVQVSYKF